jgi:cystathionine beta-lyase
MSFMGDRHPEKEGGDRADNTGKRMRGQALTARRPARHHIARRLATQTEVKEGSPNIMASEKTYGIETALTLLGRDPDRYAGFVNTPVFRGSTVLYPTAESIRSGEVEYTYGRRATPTSRAFEEAIAAIEGGHRTFLAPSGLGAVSAVLLAYAEAGGHMLIPDNVYQPTRRFAGRILSRLGVDVTYYDPLTGSGIAALIRPETRLILTEAPGSQTFEMPDIPAIAAAARAAGVPVAMDNTWATPLYFKPFAHGVNISIQAATKYIVGHSDALLGTITCDAATQDMIASAHEAIGICAGPEDCFLALRGLRTLAVRMERHWQAGLHIARWLEQRPEVARVLHPALPGCPGHEIWKRDFTGASGLFSVVLQPYDEACVCRMLNTLKLFGMGFSWGGFESLIVPFDATGYRTATRWEPEGPCLRLHIGLEDVEDLKRDLEAGFAALTAR